MTPINDELKVEAIAARRAARPAWKNAHVDRLIREREARETAKEYRRAQQGTKQCSCCAQTLPLECFSPAFRDRPTARCKPCVAAATRNRYQSDLVKARSRTRNRPVSAPRPRQTAERQRKATERHLKTLKRERELLERQRHATERVAHLTALLMGTSPGERINCEQGWDAATSELRKLWLESGDKECVSCKAVVPPSAMLPPGPANFYPGKCRSCARAEYLESHWRVYGRAPDGPRLIPMRDGTSITVAELARRHRERSSQKC